MGCCLTTTAKSPKTNSDLPKSNLNGGAPPPNPPQSSLLLPVEEETVKEVLSETPIPKPHIPTPNNGYKNHSNKLQTVVEEVKIHTPAAIKPSDEIISEVSDLSELCGFSESLSTVTEKRDDNDGEVTQCVHWSPAKKVIRKRPSMAGGIRSPARGSEPSPVRRSQLAQGRSMMTARRNAGPPNVYRRDLGERSARRSRSPVTRGEAGPRRPLRSTVTLAGRYARERTPSARENGGGEENRNDDIVVPETEGEGLENPNVSLECFIFL